MTNPGPLDSRRGPYPTTAAACIAIQNVTKTVDGVAVNYRDGVLVDIGSNGNYLTYWWKGGFADSNLVKVIPDVDLSGKADKNEGFAPWTAAVYGAGRKVSYLGKIWTCNAATTAADIPGTSSLWIEELYTYGNKAADLDRQLNGGNFSFGAQDDLSTYSVVVANNTNYSRAYYGDAGLTADGYLAKIEFNVVRTGPIPIRIMEPTGVANEFVAKYYMTFNNLPLGPATLVAGIDFADNLKIVRGSIILTLTYITSTWGCIGLKAKASNIIRNNVDSGKDLGVKYTLSQSASTQELGLKCTFKAISKIDQVNTTIKDLNVKLYGSDPTYSFGTSADMNTGFETAVTSGVTQGYFGQQDGFPSDSYLKSIEVFVAKAGRILFRLIKRTDVISVNSFSAYYLFSKTLAVGYNILTEGVDFPKNTVVYKGGALMTYTDDISYGAVGQRPAMSIGLSIVANRFTAVGVAGTAYKNSQPYEIGIRANLATINPLGELTKSVTYLTQLPALKTNYITVATAANRRNDHVFLFRTKKGFLGAVHQYRYANGNDYQPGNIVVKHSKDEGKTWTDPIFKQGTAWAEANPDVYQKENGDLIMFYSLQPTSATTRNLLSAVSTDDGLTWSQPVDYGLTLAPSGTGALKASNGQIYKLIYGGSSGIKILKSTDNGGTFVDQGLTLKDVADAAYVDGTSATEPGIYETTPGTFILWFRSLYRGYCRAMKSIDYGASWSAPFNLFKAPDSMSSIKKITFYNASLGDTSVYLAVHNRLLVDLPVGQSEDRKFMVLSVSRDGLTFVTTDVLIYSYTGNTNFSRSFEPNIFDDGHNIKIGWSTYKNTDTSNELESALFSVMSYADLQKLVDFYIPV